MCENEGEVDQSTNTISLFLIDCHFSPFTPINPGLAITARKTGHLPMAFHSEYNKATSIKRSDWECTHLGEAKYGTPPNGIALRIEDGLPPEGEVLGNAPGGEDGKEDAPPLNIIALVIEDGPPLEGELIGNVMSMR